MDENALLCLRDSGRVGDFFFFFSIIDYYD